MEFIVIGRIGRPVGLQGECIVTPMTYDPARFQDLTYVYVTDALHRRLKIDSVRYLPNGIHVRFAGITDRDSVAQLRNKMIEIDAAERIELPDDVYFHDDLVGCEVADSNGTIIGRVTEVRESTANDLYVVRNADEKELMIPAIDPFIASIDTEEKRISIREIPGLLDLWT